MPVADRLDVTLRLVQAAGRISVADLADRLGVSEMTVRRDLDALQAQGLLQRIRGAATATREPESGFAARAKWQEATKARIGALAASLIRPGETVLLDAGTTTVHVAAALAERAPVTVGVLSLQAAARLTDVPGVRLLLLGGEPRPAEGSLVGPITLRALSELSFDCFVLSLGGIHAEDGYSEFSLEDSAVKQLALGRASRTIAVADATKLGTRAFSRIAGLDAAAEFVTDSAAEDPETHPVGPRTLDALREAGTTVHLA
ncbi:DNA-binding transcriptional regulator of sugar metabolism, DeoR/GlpR family [Amycolatopsis xylanica]|uniref:Lactose phosphotransferase system repressor n=1 Tax=Amycolatopsis xylanica TaxID=589385 RepID=A0A1H3HNV4_9PSEU|nr:DeoR/GlpR family DNA-binding transcription regulator [Amycolatopsis xylanica]SDY17167.1 DNA-binding transcriptional regulator of sugar metabolism, DeoR/GlpR family [Amycolatopsis xylanica]